MKRSNRGFTLAELLIVMVLIGILASIAIPQFKHATLKAKEAVLKENLYVLRKVIDDYYSDKGKYPPSLEALVEEGYLRRIPIDPITGSDKTWVVIREPLTEENMYQEELGIIDVKSGSKEISLDGTPYNTW
ncbi:type II secretion system GspH family protein [Candidatus Aminicenantes bacterium AC-335-G13]|nr:type II secretion system GspH family protein [Candidatus Aminicenantes bacterium AC-335-G13]MCP2597720.1 type II secretion system GspH family protein [Candidatus Aminicenantes bacterium AC-335-L06]